MLCNFCNNENQLKLFDFIEINSCFDRIIEEKKDCLHVVASERIMSLKKNRKSLIFGPKIEITDFFSKAAILNNHQKGDFYLATFIIKKLMETVRPLVKRGFKNNVYKMESELKSLIGENVISNYINSLAFTEEDCYIIGYYSGGNGCFRNTGVLSGCKEDWSIEPLKKTVLGQRRYLRKDAMYLKSRERTIMHQLNDVTLLYARAILYNAISGYISQLNDDEKETDKLYNTLLEAAKASVFYFQKDGVVYTDGSAEANSLVNNLISAGVEIKLEDLSEISEEQRKDMNILTKEIACKINVSLDILNFRLPNIEHYIGATITSRRSYIDSSDIDKDLAKYIFILLEREYENEIVRKYEKNNSSTYALSYQEKKNIPIKVRKAMQHSRFLNYFGYVEIDEECDLDRVNSLYDEWEPLAEMLLKQKYDNVSLRFRKLGNHKAAGLYYPMHECICVDIRYPDSFVHEVFHMIDYQSGCLSRQYDFDNVIRHYKRAFEKCIKEGDIKLSGKYDKSYYFVPTEIFARCGEIYLTRILGIYNSLVNPDEDQEYAYPHDDTLERAIKSYYEKLI